MQKYNYGKLKGRIIEKFGSQKAFAEKLGWSEGKLSKKLNNGDRLKLSLDESGHLNKQEITEWFQTIADYYKK